MSAVVFDRLAATYDERWTATPTGRAQRTLVWRHVNPSFLPGQRILDVGCGTGEDAAHFAGLGVRVHGIDASAAMVRVAQSRGGFSVEVGDARNLGGLAGEFDGVLSNFGALNCVRDLRTVAEEIGRLMRPGSTAAICLLGRVCLWETLYYGMRLRWRKAFRRWTGNGVAYHEMTVYYPKASEVCEAFGTGFELRKWTGIGLCVPPSYVKLPAGAVRWLAACDGVLARLPILRGLADHRLFMLVRK